MSQIDFQKLLDYFGQVNTFSHLYIHLYINCWVPLINSPIGPGNTCFNRYILLRIRKMAPLQDPG